MADIISTASAPLQLVGRLREINKNIANAEFSNALADLAIELAELKIKLAAVVEENDSLKRQLSSRQAESLRFEGFAYYSSSGEGPFCPGCYDTGRKSIRLTRQSPPFDVFGSHSCPACKEHFGEGR